MQKRVVTQIFQRFEQANPRPVTELNYNSEFELLISVILSAQTTDINVNKATAKLYKIANTPQQIFDLGVEQLKQYIRSIGLYNTKARNIIKTCRILIDQYQQQVPRSRAQLEQLPGVGRKTANVVLNTAFNQPTMAVDTHVFRVSNRTKIASGSTVLAVEKKLLQVIPDSHILNAHHWLILHGRYVCTAKKPKCISCSIADLCQYPHKNTAA